MFSSSIVVYFITILASLYLPRGLRRGGRDGRKFKGLSINGKYQSEYINFSIYIKTLNVDVSGYLQECHDSHNAPLLPPTCY